MAFGNFKETNENKESSVDNTEKPKNQLLETPKDYEDDFDKKVDTADKKEEKNTESNSDKGGEENKGFFSKIKGLIKPKEESNSENQESKNEDTEQTKDNEFAKKYKVDNSDNHIEKQAMEKYQENKEKNTENTEDDDKQRELER